MNWTVLMECEVMNDFPVRRVLKIDLKNGGNDGVVTLGDPHRNTEGSSLSGASSIRITLVKYL